MAEQKSQVEKIIENMSPEEWEKVTQDTQTAIQKMVDEGIPLYKALNMPRAVIDVAYNDAYQKYKAGHYEKAQKVFEFLFTLDHYDNNYILCTAACLQMRKLYAAAINAYLLLSSRIPTSPLPYFYIYECYMQLNQHEDARRALENVIKLADANSDDYKQMAEKARLMLEGHVAMFSPSEETAVKESKE